MARPLCRAEHIMERVVRPAIYLLKLTLRSDCGGWTPPDTITPADNFVHAKARVTDNVDLAFGPCLASLHELQMLLLTYCVNGDDTTLPPLLERCLNRSLVIAKSGQLIRPTADFTAFLPGHKGEIWIGQRSGSGLENPSRLGWRPQEFPGSEKSPRVTKLPGASLISPDGGRRQRRPEVQHARNKYWWMYGSDICYEESETPPEPMSA
ncbi:hypothetical protein B0H14DRAFT_3148696 [Mycena olivaceomarginata]|nr:hypothetical protein B0H14DRAFT_3148696 [Mycena olivaceomarginata]